MPDHDTPKDKNAHELSINPDAKFLTATYHNSKTCRLTDNTNSVPSAKLQELLDQLISEKHFGINAISATNGIIDIDKPKISHIQIDGQLYQLFLYRYHAIIENF